jgi:hypothetical protein
MTGQEAALAVVDALEAAGMPHMIVGSFSTNRYGIERSTHDADFVVELGGRTIFAIKPYLPAEVRIDPQMSFETVTMTRRYVATVEGSYFKIEFFILSDDPHDQERFARRRGLDMVERTLWYPTPEDVIITKLRWALLAHRSKDRDDARDVIAVQDVDDTLDWSYIHKWCDIHGTRALLDEVRASIPPI